MVVFGYLKIDLVLFNHLKILNLKQYQNILKIFKIINKNNIIKCKYLIQNIVFNQIKNISRCLIKFVNHKNQ